ncbi:beta-galactosidase [Sphingomonas populi]|uniref:Beta-galactosidase n=1 Tax=Sphingomonas populi TaxID=2484750 RepID=A0A4Q6Y7G6_9SPHN|nr:glycoside hydrolase family 2 TIM barrel-domain containing protein [Sphingomonas populi]RZF66312.1 beta-galactosidase [Sphingomonas populi]
MNIRRLAYLGSLAVVLASLTGPLAANGQAPRSADVGTSGRSRTNFNADWRFKLGENDAAQAAAFDDRSWSTVGLPHSFSEPYFRAAAFYTGDGWYRQSFTLPPLPAGQRLSLEFEGAFQDARVYVNGIELAHHRGGYTGFPVDISAAVRPGRNVVAVRVNNAWQPTLAPRAGEHVFSGGLYRDVWLVRSDAVHVPWTGTRITTPELSAASGKVVVETEVRNDGAAAATVTVRTQVVDAGGTTVASLPDAHVSVAPGATVVASQRSAPIARPRLWSPETPALYHAATTLIVGGRARDRFDTEFGFRWFKWTADKGFFLNGQHRYFRGANVHQDQAGWGDAVTNGAIDRDVRLIKDAGFDFIRGSHYPHDPHFAEATDRQGMLFLPEVPFWGTAGFKNSWGASAYPTDPAQRAAFDANVKQQLTELIRINRNHPSIIAWGMDNEVFFSAKETMPDVKRLLREEVDLTHQLDATRPASIDGAQRGDIDKLGDIVGYNGDGASLFPNPGIPNFVAEYGVTMTDRPGAYAPGWDDLPNTVGADKTREGSWRLPWRSGEVIWAGFDHGSIAGKRFGGMGMIDYFRLPKRQYYWYRNAYARVAPPVWPVAGTPAALRITTSSPTIARADGTDDVQVIVSVVDAAGKRLSNSPPVHLVIESGPGELPTGRAIDFAPDSDIVIRDGEAAIAMRSWQAGVTRLRATSAGLQDGTAQVRTLQGPAFVAGKTPLAADRPYVPFVPAVRERAGDGVFGLNNPTFSSSNAPDHSSRLANDGNAATYWAPATGDATGTITIDMERVVEVHRLTLSFPQAGTYGFVAEVQDSQGTWQKLAEQIEGQDSSQTRTVETEAHAGRNVRVRLRAPAGAIVGLAELQITGALRTD